MRVALREALRGDRSHVSPFHRRRSRAFWGVFFGFCVVGCLLLVCLFLFGLLPRSRDQSSSCTK